MLEYTIGREAEISRIKELINKGSDCLCLGSAGIGKSHILQKVAGQYHARAVYLPYANQLKANLELIIKRLDPNVRQEVLKAGGNFETYKLPARRTDQLIYWVKTLVDPRDKRGRSRLPRTGKPIIIFDHFERATPSLRPLFDVLLD